MTTKQLRVRPLCGKCEAGWLYDDTDGTATRCPCRTAPSPEERVDEALRAVADAHKDSFSRAKDIIRETAKRMEEFSSNDCHYAFELAQIPRGIPGAAFTAITREGLIEHTGRFVQSDDPATRHRVGLYRSLAFVPDQRAKAAGE